MKKHQTSKDNFKEIFLRFYVCVFYLLSFIFNFSVSAYGSAMPRGVAQ